MLRGAQGIIERAATQGSALGELLRERLGENSIVGDIRGRGMFCASLQHQPSFLLLSCVFKGTATDSTGARVAGGVLAGGVELVKDRKTKEPFAAELGVTARIVKAAFSRGMMLVGGSPGCVRFHCHLDFLIAAALAPATSSPSSPSSLSCSFAARAPILPSAAAAAAAAAAALLFEDAKLNSHLIHLIHLTVNDNGCARA